MRMNTIGLLLACVILAGCHHRGVRGSGVETTQERSLDEFTAVDISGTFGVTIRCGEKPGATVIADDNLVSLVKTEVRGSTLHIFPEKDIDPRTDLRIEVTTPSLSDVSVSGVASVDIKNVQGEKLNLDVNGAASILARGTVKDASFNISGAGKLSTEDLHSANVRVAMSGAGKADVYASDNLEVDVSGAGVIHYSGDPKTVNKRISGVGVVSRK